MKKLRFFDSLKFVLATVACTLILNIAHADNDTQLWKYTPLAVSYHTNSATVVSTESDGNFNTYTVKASPGSNRCLYVNTENSLPANHKYFINVRFKSTFTGKPYFRYSLDGGTTFQNIGYNNNCQPNTWCNLSAVITPQQDWSFTGVFNGIVLQSGNYIAGETITIDKNGFVTVFDLTEIFGAGNEPTTVVNAKRALSIDTTIKIATTRYNEEQFEPVKTDLSAAVNAVEYVVSNTMTQAQQIDQIANEKQTRPAEGCTAKYCLLVEDEDGTPHWYPIAGANGVEYVLPSGYTELQYIESTGTQYIDTGYIPTSTSILDISITNFQTMQTSGRCMFGCGEGMWSSSKGWIGSIAASAGKAVWNRQMTDINVTYQTLGITTGNGYTLQYGSNAIFVDGVKKIDFNGSSSAVPQSYDRSFWLFHCNNNSSDGGGGAWKFGRTTLSDNGVLVRNLVPARRNSDNEIGMYDLADPNPSTAFHTNAGTGTFTAGPDM